MKTKAGIALAVFALSMVAAASYAADESPFAGVWATDRIADVEMPKKAGFLAQMAASAVNGGNTTSSIGNTNGTPTFSAPTVNTNSRNRNSGPTRPTAGPSAAAGNKAAQDDPVAKEKERAELEAKAAADKAANEPPIILELKVDAKGKLTGSVTEITMIPFARKDLKVEEGTVTDKKFEFKTIEKSEKVSNTTRWVGELTDERTITLMRLTKGGNPIDPDGSIVFRRAKK